MRKLIFIIIWLISFSVCNGQTKKILKEDGKIQRTIISFLTWYKINLEMETDNAIIDSTNTHSSIVIEEYIDTLVKLSVDMKAVEGYLNHIRRSNCVSESFINDLRQYHQKIANEVKMFSPYPKSEGRFSIPGLNLDAIFGFEPEEILDHIKEGKFTKIYRIYDKAIVKFDISRLNQFIFTLTKINGKWLIDYYGIDRTNFDKWDKKSRERK